MGAPTNRRNLFPFNQTSKMFQVAGICSLPYSWRIQMIVPPNSNFMGKDTCSYSGRVLFPIQRSARAHVPGEKPQYYI